MTQGTMPGPGGWTLTAEGAAYFASEKTAVIADVHLGYEWARGKSGDCVPAHSLRETVAKLNALFSRFQPERLIVAGDFVESPIDCRRTARDVHALSEWLGSIGVELINLAGNHDPPRRPPWPASMEVGGWTIAHGHKPLTATRTITGHLHPVLRSGRVNAPCFVVGPRRIILPAFSPNAAGVGLEALPRKIGAGPLHCLATAGGELLDCGPTQQLVSALTQSSRINPGGRGCRRAESTPGSPGGSPSPNRSRSTRAKS